MAETRRRPRADRSEATRAKLVAAARELFREHGYGGVGTEEVVRRADVTRGALYHHFADKRDLFRAVHEQVEAETIAAIAAEMESAETPYALLETGIRSFLDVCTDPAVTRITLIDAPPVLGWAEWREIDMRHGLGLVVAGLQGAIDAGALAPRPVVPLAHLLVGAMGEAGMMIANADDPEAARAEVEPALLGLLEALRA